MNRFIRNILKTVRNFRSWIRKPDSAGRLREAEGGRSYRLRYILISISAISFFLQNNSFAFAQASDEGQRLQVPWLNGNILAIMFVILLIGIATRSSRRDDSAIPNEFGVRPNARSRKRKKGKLVLDFSKGAIMHPEISNTLGLTLIGWVIGLPLIFSLPTASRIYQEVKNDPRFKGEGLAQTVLILNYVGIGVFALLILAVVAIVLMIMMGKGG